ncbi:MAG: anion transporter [Gammaproteobacteria bacterium]|nr:anion transporter [Gammaproteobacteria bacterium]
MPLAIIFLILILFVISIRNFLPVSLPIWLVMLFGAIAMVLTQQIGFIAAIHSIDMDIIFYLLGVFVIAQSVESCGLLEYLTEKLFSFNCSGWFLLFVIVFFLGLGSAVLMNDAVAIIGTPVILQLCRKQKVMASLLLMTLAYAVTLGSVLSPIGNPQNLLVAIKSGMHSPFLTFFVGLGLPTIINLGVLYFFIFILYRKQLAQPLIKLSPVLMSDSRTVLAAQLSFYFFILLIMAKIVLSLFQIEVDFAAIALISALPTLLLSRKRKHVLRHLDWGTLIFFIAMFVVMQSVWNSGFFQEWIYKFHVSVDNMLSIVVISTLLSQLISNVPLVALYIPLLQNVDATVSHYLLLAASSTLAGNIFIFGAASNIIIIQNAEKRGFKGLSIGLFSLLGIPLTIIHLSVYAFFLSL